MSNFQINFSYPWLLLLLIPAVFFTLFSYFRLNKKYRRTRNRIISIVLHLTALVLGITGLAGINFSYDEPNPENELVILVDESYSGTRTEAAKDGFVKNIIESNDASVKVGVVSFGYNQVLAAPMSFDMNEVYNSYINAEKPDDSATDIASALIYAKSLITYPKTSKIVLITDGVETDGEALSVIKLISAEGVKVDVVHFPAERMGNEIQIIGIEMPETRIEVNEILDIAVTLQSSYSGDANITLYDNDEKGITTTVNFVEGINIFKVSHTFAEKELHTLKFEISGTGDTLKENNEYHSYVFLEDFNKILIVERTAGESDDLQTMLSSKAVGEGEVGYNITTVCVSDIENMPKSTNQLRQYDQVILVNIAHADMPIYDSGESFEQYLYDYVYKYGGGLLTIGGNKDEKDADGGFIANTYDRDDMYGTLYQDMLPVEAIDYTPPVGVMLVIDWSGSMSSVDGVTGKTYLELAKEGARAAVNAMTERDYCGIVSLEDSYKEEIKPIPLPKKEELMAAIDNLGEDQAGGGTVYQGAIEQAGAALKKLTVVERKHIILLSDGAPSDSLDDYKGAIQSNTDAGITMSIVIVGGGGNERELKKAVEIGKGRYYNESISNVPEIMRKEIELPEIKSVNYEPFNAQIDKTTEVVKGITQEALNEVELGGYYGTKIKVGAEQILKGNYVPLYAQWKYGDGIVGSFMCDLSSSDWSKDFVESGVGKMFINNAVGEIFPVVNIRAPEIEVALVEDNYSTQVNIYPTASAGKTSFDVSVTPVKNGKSDPSDPNKQQSSTDESGYYRKTVFDITTPGVHEVQVNQISENNEQVASCLTYKAFSYSKEYDMFFDAEAVKAMLVQLTEDGNGSIITHAAEAYIGFEKVLHRVYDPIIPFIITALVLFLLDIAVRKFKFKWPHEIIRDHKAKKLLENKNGDSK